VSGATEPASSDDTFASLTLRAFEVPGASGFMVGLASSGAYAGPELDNRFYSIGELPPPGLPAVRFWAVMLAEVAQFLYREASDE